MCLERRLSRSDQTATSINTDRDRTQAMGNLRTTIDGKKFVGFFHVSYPHLKWLSSHRGLETMGLRAVTLVGAYFTSVLRQIRCYIVVSCPGWKSSSSQLAFDRQVSPKSL